MPPSRKPEVMSPAGYWPQLNAAIEAGADACYFGLKHFSARAKVGFDLGELPGVMRTLHSRGVRGYLTFNTLIFEHELAEAARAIGSIAEAGVDAIIVQDIGVLKLARRIAPDLEIHASTQTSITSAEGVEFALALGAHRVTLARELSLQEVAAIYTRTQADLEIFVHGALCVAYSGQCFSSEAWGGRSANRGQCAQACRLPYEMLVDGELKPLADTRYLLSPGDLSALRHVPQIIEAGVSCLKIEGRYKDVDYVALTTRAYRQAVDDAWAGRPASITPRQELELEQVYSRGLGPYFISGTNHQAVVNGRNPRHRGVQIGTVVAVHDASVSVRPAAAHEIAPLKAGDGVVFDAAIWRSPQEPEEGGRIYHALPQLSGVVELTFANNAVNFRRIRSGDLLWRTHDPELDRAVRLFLDPVAPVAKQPLTVHVTARENEPLRIRWSLPKGLSVHVEAPGPLIPAQNRGLNEETLRAQLGRLGTTPYELAGLTVDISGSVFAPASLLNQMRREAVDKLQELQSRPLDRVIHPVPEPRRSLQPASAAIPQLHVLVRNPEQLDAAIAARPDSITLDYLDLYGLRPSVERVKAAGVQVRVATPRIL
ncbi:MAG: U32 family peptidase, partial [Bryobacteraceae bacterium]